MKKVLGALFAASLLFGGGVKTAKVNAQTDIEKSVVCSQTNEVIKCNASKNESLQLHAKSAYLMDFATGTPVYSVRETEHLPIASMCKIMTLILSFEAIDEGIMTMDEEISVSERAASMGGSQVFLEANAKYPVRELIKSIVVCSANDSCVAMAEKIAGNEAAFTDKMNEKAKALGATDTLFANCTGLPKEPQYSCAKDVAIMLKELLSHEEYFEFGKVWMDKFSHPEGRYTEITNTNKLVRFYEGCDGGKTGFTNQAGFCLAATAKRNNMRVISVVIGEENSKNRFDDVRSMFDYAFASYTMKTVVEAGVPLEQRAIVNGGKEKSVVISPLRSAYAFTKRGEKQNIKLETQYYTLNAPLQKGDKAGEIIVYKDNVEVERVSLVVNNDVEKATLFDRIQDVAKGWNARK